MIEVQKILVPIDFSEPSAKALLYGKALARIFGGSLHVLHVIETPFRQGYAVEGYVAALPEFSRELEARTRAELRKQLSDSERSELRAVEVTGTGDPVSEIVRYARDQEVDIIVMGTHGRGTVTHLLLGSVAELVVRKAPCPVLTVRAREHDFVLPDIGGGIHRDLTA